MERTILAAAALAILTALPIGAADPPTPEEIRGRMGIPSRGTDLRGQLDTVGYASTAEQMARVVELSASAPRPRRFGEPPPSGAVAVIAPHDDYLYAGRVYREALAPITARTVILVGVFHRYRSLGIRDRIVFDPYRAWRTPDGEVPVSDLREELIAGLPPDVFLQDAAGHDSEHSLEGLVHWLRHDNPDLEIVPLLAPASRFHRLRDLADALGRSLAAALEKRRWRLGTDVAVVISADAVHYGPDFRHVPFGEGGIEAYTRAVERDVGILHGPLAGPVKVGKVHDLYRSLVDPENPDDYRITWCGRFSVPFGMLLLESISRKLGLEAPAGRPVAYDTSVGLPELPVREFGLDATAPANLYHFVGHPAVAFY